MIYHRTAKPGLFLTVCGNFWPGAPERNDYYDHLIHTSMATCDGKRPNTQKKRTCKPTPNPTR